ncbi:MAG: hypothetical protein HDR02_16525 [Lachnospiraceae bacterium]|nr:hypothetical protein [Lachnospiraceae bacterium]
MVIYLIRMFGISLALTLATELAIAFLFGLRTRKNVLLVVLVNMLTNPPAVLCNWLCRLYLPCYSRVPVQLVIEAAVVIVEAFVYCRFARDEQRQIERPVLLAITANGCSWLLGLLIETLKVL